MKFNQRLKVVNREGGGASLVSGRFSAGLGRPVPAQRRCGPPGIMQLALIRRGGPASLSAVSAIGAWSVFLSASCQVYLAVSSEFVPPIPTLMWCLGGSHVLPFTILFLFLSFFCVSSLHPVSWSCPDVIGAEASRRGGASGLLLSKLPPSTATTYTYTIR